MMSDMDQDSDGKINHQEFVDYYTNISANMLDDFAFKEFIYSAWGLNGV